jgi:hypothetical protein
MEVVARSQRRDFLFGAKLTFFQKIVSIIESIFNIHFFNPTLPDLNIESPLLILG